MTRLSDIQLILLTTASQREDGSLLPPPENIGGAGARIHKTVAALLKRGLAAEVEVATPERTWREDGDRRIGLIITADGRAALGLEAEGTGGERMTATPEEQSEISDTSHEHAGSAEAAQPIAELAAVTTRGGSKQALVLELLGTGNGVTITDLVEATGWLPHTTRAALTGFRKRGIAINKEKVDGVTRYSTSAGAQA